MGTRLLEVDAKAIKFICEVKKQSTSSVHLTNISDEYIAFKVMTTSPKRFCVRPNSGVISPKSACDFSVTMQGLRSPASEVECKDKFLIQATVVDSGTREEDVTSDLFSKSSGKYVEDKKLRVILVSMEDYLEEEQKNQKQDPPVEEHKIRKQDPPVEEHKHKKQDPPVEEHKHKKQDPPVEEHKHKKQDPPVEEHKHKKQDPPVEEHKHKEEQDPTVEEHKHKKQDHHPVEEHKHKKQDHPVEEHKHKKEDHPVEEHKHKKQDPTVEEHKHKRQDPPVEEQKHTREDPPVEEHKHKRQDPPVEEHKHKRQDPPVEEHKHKKQDPSVEEHKHKKKDSPVEEHRNKVLEQETSNETKLVKKDEHVSPKHMRAEEAKEVKTVLPKEEPKPSGDLDGNERTVSKNLKFNPVKVVKEDPQKKLRLRNQLKDLKLKESTLENQLKEAKSTISTLTYQNSKIIEAKEILQMELDRRSKKGFSFASVCLASLIGVIAGGWDDVRSLKSVSKYKFSLTIQQRIL